MFVEAYLSTATHLVEIYNNQMPLHIYVKEYFKNNKKFGSRDRKYISELVFAYYRLGQTENYIPIREKFLVAAFLSGKLPSLFFEKTHYVDYAKLQSDDFSAKLNHVMKQYPNLIKAPYAFTESYHENLFIQDLFSPKQLFIRIRKNKHGIVEKLKQSSIAYHFVDSNCISLPLGTNLETLLLPEDYVVQDIASQFVGHTFQPSSKQSWWDCCCASGGKSIQLLDANATIDLTMSDIRATILKELHQRMQRYGYSHAYRSYEADCSQSTQFLNLRKMDGIICDVPCSGSGTWSRAPENFYYFSEVKLNNFHALQCSILRNAIQHLKPNGKLFYITCSVFREENEAVVHTILQEGGTEIIEQKLIHTSSLGGDSLFVAIIRLLS